MSHCVAGHLVARQNRNDATSLFCVIVALWQSHYWAVPSDVRPGQVELHPLTNHLIRHSRTDQVRKCDMGSNYGQIKGENIQMWDRLYLPVIPARWTRSLDQEVRNWQTKANQKSWCVWVQWLSSQDIHWPFTQSPNLCSSRAESYRSEGRVFLLDSQWV